MSTTTRQTTTPHDQPTTADTWPAHIDVAVLEAAIDALGASIGQFDHRADECHSPAPRYRAVGSTARAYAALADALADAYEASTVPDSHEAQQCIDHLKDIEQERVTIEQERATRPPEPMR